MAGEAVFYLCESEPGEIIESGLLFYGCGLAAVVGKNNPGAGHAGKTTVNFYNDNDSFCVEWLKYLAENLFIPGGEFDGRSIADVETSDIAGFKQCHFFAGIGGWSRALEIAGWPEDEPVWTASCPCQPFSIAGKQKGAEDARHLWPEVYRLINECRPAIAFGEQVASPAGWAWFDSVRADLEKSGYAVGAAGLCAAGIGAPHIRQRIYWVAVRNDKRFPISRFEGRQPERAAFIDDSTRGVCNPDRHGLQPGDKTAAPEGYGDSINATNRDDVGGLEDYGYGEGRHCQGEEIRGKTKEGGADSVTRPSAFNIGVYNPGGAGLERYAGDGPGSGKPGWNTAQAQRPTTPPTAGPWVGCEFVPCSDGKARPIKPGILPVADGFPERVGLIRGYGNAIVPQVAAAFIRGVMSYG